MASACISAPGNGSIYCEIPDDLFSDMQPHASDARWRVEWHLSGEETYRFRTSYKLPVGHGDGNRSNVVSALKPGSISEDRRRLPSQPRVTLEPQLGRSA
jgi:hypothetical protein